MRAEISFMGITEAMPTDMLVAAMGDKAERVEGRCFRLCKLVVNVAAATVVVGTGRLLCAVT